MKGSLLGFNGFLLLLIHTSRARTIGSMPLAVPCPACGKLPPPPCACTLPPGPAGPKRYPETLKLRREKRTGREVIVIEGWNPGTRIDLDDLARELRRACATGGTVKGRTIEIQGDHRERIAEILLARGYRSKRAP